MSLDPKRPYCDDPIHALKALDMYTSRSGVAPFPVRDVGLPTWDKEQMVFRAFWRIRLVHELRRAVNEGLIVGWDEMETHKLNDLSLLDIYDFEEMASLVCVIDAFAGGSSWNDYHELVEQNVIITVMDWLRQYPPSSWRLSYVLRLWLMPARHPEQRDFEHELCSRIEEYTQAYKTDEYSEILWYGCYRRLGFAIWSHERLQGYGFMRDETPDPVTYISVLRPQDFATLKQGFRRPTNGERELPRTTRTTVKGEVFMHTNAIVEHEIALMDEEWDEIHGQTL
ncbi:hypothetical protein ANO11243_062310 [Dothideomycetidae sp. 11243]|nr:hypothetical protein ANO11243_062310 [fungal sp. No.11243]